MAALSRVTFIAFCGRLAGEATVFGMSSVSDDLFGKVDEKLKQLRADTAKTTSDANQGVRPTRADRGNVDRTILRREASRAWHPRVAQ